MAEDMVPQSRAEEILIATINGNEYTAAPQSRLEYRLLELKDVIEEGSGGGSVHFVVVEELPTTDIDQTAIYLVPKSTAATSNVYDEYINTDGTTSGWELIGSTDIDLSDYITDSDLATILEDYATTQDLSGKQDTLTAGKYISIDANDEIKVERVVPNEAFNYVLQQTADYTLKVTKYVNNVVVSEETYGPPTTWDTPIEVTLDEAINIYISLVGNMFYELLIASDSHDAGFKQTMSWFGRNTYTENFSTVDHTGEKLIIKSELDTAINAIKDGQSIDSFSDVETALAGKQAALTAGKYISIDGNNEIEVERVIPNETASYNLKTISTSDPDIVTRITKTVNGVVAWTRDINYQDVRDTAATIDDTFTLAYTTQWVYTLLIDSDDHTAGYVYNWGWSAWVDFDEDFSLADHTGEKLIIKSEMDTALAGKASTSDLATKADLTDLAPAFSTSTAYTVGQYVSYDGNIYKCTSAHSAGAWVAGDFTLVAIGSELTELNSNLTSKQNATDNNLQTTAKTVIGAINELDTDMLKKVNFRQITIYPNDSYHMPRIFKNLRLLEIYGIHVINGNTNYCYYKILSIGEKDNSDAIHTVMIQTVEQGITLSFSDYYGGLIITNNNGYELSLLCEECSFKPIYY